MIDRNWDSQIHFNQQDPLKAALKILQDKGNHDRMSQMLYMDFCADTTDAMSADEWEALMDYEKQRDLERNSG